MRALFFAAMGSVVLAVLHTANAADVPPPMVTKAPPPPPPVVNWTGFYIGANGGGGWANQSSSLTGADAPPLFGLSATTAGSGSATGSGGLAGGQIGFNYEFPTHVVLGIEADGDWAHIAGSSSGCSTFTSPPVFAGIVAGCGLFNNSLNDFGTIRGRLGYAWNNVLLFGTGGWAWGHSSGNFSLTCLTEVLPACPAPQPGLAFAGGTASFSNTLSGWTAGGGVEWMFLPHWTFRVEYLHLEFDNVSTNYSYTTTFPGVAFPASVHVSSNNGINIVRAGINYLFNFGGPASAM